MIDWVERVSGGLDATRARMRLACERAGRPLTSVRLLAVSKRHPPEALAAAYSLGQRDFGESYVQELSMKRRALDLLTEARYRLIGHVQKNKAKDAARLGCAIDSLDSVELADALNRRADALGTTLEVLIEVNVDSEPQKAGVLPNEALPLADHIRACTGLRLEGFMCIPRAGSDERSLRAAFGRLRKLGEQAATRELSMGMSDDLELAIEEGSTMVRIGTAIFGARD
jgi:pyridoxal phosphate enzyme (YggS family)